MVKKISNWIEQLEIVKWFRTLQRIVRRYDIDKEGIHSKIAYATDIAHDAEQVIRDRTDLSAGIDISTNMPNQVIVVGRYNGRDYVEVFSILDADFSRTIDMLREQQKYAGLQHIDAPLNMRCVIDQQLWR